MAGRFLDRVAYLTGSLDRTEAVMRASLTVLPLGALAIVVITKLVVG